MGEDTRPARPWRPATTAEDLSTTRYGFFSAVCATLQSRATTLISFSRLFFLSAKMVCTQFWDVCVQLPSCFRLSKNGADHHLAARAPLLNTECVRRNTVPQLARCKGRREPPHPTLVMTGHFYLLAQKLQRVEYLGSRPLFAALFR